MKAGWTVHKFGGTSLADADRYRAACQIILSAQTDERVAVVVSAMSGVTNALIESVDLAATHDESYLQKLQALENRHLETITALQLQNNSHTQRDISLPISKRSKKCCEAFGSRDFLPNASSNSSPVTESCGRPNYCTLISKRVAILDLARRAQGAHRRAGQQHCRDRLAAFAGESKRGKHDHAETDFARDHRIHRRHTRWSRDNVETKRQRPLCFDLRRVARR